MLSDSSRAIEVRGISKAFAGSPALDDVTFSVARGEVLGFLGPNAAGKTTTMRILTCYLAPDSGSASVAGHDVLEDPMAVRRHIGYLPENAPLYTDMEVGEHLRFIALARGLTGAEKDRRISRTVELCGLGDVLGSRVGTLSKGYRQRVGLANTLVHDPEVLILDEPTTGLDPMQIVEIRELVREIGRERTVVLSTHILPEVEATCSRVLIINRGRLVAEGTPAELSERSVGVGVTVAILAPGADVEHALDSLPSVRGIERLGENEEGYARFALAGSSESELTDDVFALVRDRGWRLRELSPSGVSLEDIFLDLTSPERLGPATPGERSSGAGTRSSEVRERPSVDDDGEVR